MIGDQEFNIKAESTWTNPAVRSLQDLYDWILVSLGAPLVTVELSQEQLNLAVQNSLEKYTKYAYFGPDKYLVVNVNKYEHGRGINLAEFDVASVKDVSFQRDNAFLMSGDLFWSSYAFLGQGGGYPFLNNSGNSFTGSWVTWHNVHEFFELSKRMTGSNPDWQYDKMTKYLKLMPEPKPRNGQPHVILCTCQCIPPLHELYGNEYVKRLALAYAKILLGTVRKKFQGVQLPGGGTIDTSIGDEGREELKEIMDGIIKDESKGQCAYII